MKEEYKALIAGHFHMAGGAAEGFLQNITVREVPAKTVLLSEGDVATKLFLVMKGCLRAYFIKENGMEVTSQFFIEGQMVASFESAMTGSPSRLYIDTVEDSVLAIIQVKHLERMIRESNHAGDYFHKFLVSRLISYMNLHASFILDNPEKRYRRLLQENPELVARLPQQYIASYLGITPVSLSRIRARLRRQINNR